MTLGDCTFEDDDIIDIITSPDAATCQAICEIFAGCTFFHFDRLKGDENCVLLTESYRQLCHSIGSPVVSNCISLTNSNNITLVNHHPLQMIRDNKKS